MAEGELRPDARKARRIACSEEKPLLALTSARPSSGCWLMSAAATLTRVEAMLAVMVVASSWKARVIWRVETLKAAAMLSGPRWGSA